MSWKDGSSENITFFEIIQKIKTHNEKKGQVFIGTDSHIKQGKCTFTTSVVLLGAEGQCGGIYFYNKETIPLNLCKDAMVLAEEPPEPKNINGFSIKTF